jgi:hypothetical protein
MKKLGLKTKKEKKVYMYLFNSVQYKLCSYRRKFDPDRSTFNPLKISKTGRFGRVF